MLFFNALYPGENMDLKVEAGAVAEETTEELSQLSSMLRQIPGVADGDALSSDSDIWGMFSIGEEEETRDFLLLLLFL